VSSQTIYPPITLASWSSKTVIERANGYSSSGAKIYDATRTYNALMQLIGSGYGVIAQYPNDDIAPSKTFTQITAPSDGIFPNNLTDHNDSTGVYWNTPVGSTLSAEVADLFSIDFGNSFTGFLRFYVYSINNASLTIYGSKDNSTWTSLMANINSAGEQTLFINGYRYVKFTGAGTVANTTGTMYIATVEAFIVYSLPYSRSLSYNGNLKVYAQGYYQLLEVISA
jgi:hypothetical protein